MKNIISILLGSVILLSSCTKSIDNANIVLAKQMLQNKIWYMDYSATGGTTKSYLGQSTYFISFVDNTTVRDSDGVSGDYSVIENKGQVYIKVSAKTISGNTIGYTNLIESIGSKNMVLVFESNGVVTKQYYTTR